MILQCLIQAQQQLLLVHKTAGQRLTHLPEFSDAM
jgi:hypothetical protein